MAKNVPVTMKEKDRIAMDSAYCDLSDVFDVSSGDVLVKEAKKALLAMTAIVNRYETKTVKIDTRQLKLPIKIATKKK